MSFVDFDDATVILFGGKDKKKKKDKSKKEKKEKKQKHKEKKPKKEKKEKVKEKKEKKDKPEPFTVNVSGFKCEVKPKDGKIKLKCKSSDGVEYACDELSDEMETTFGHADLKGSFDDGTCTLDSFSLKGKSRNGYGVEDIEESLSEALEKIGI